MADDRSELQRLRALKRIHELESKASGISTNSGGKQDPLLQAQKEDMDRQVAVGQKLAPAMAGIGKGFVEASSRGNVDVPNTIPGMELPSGSEGIGRGMAAGVELASLGPILGKLPGAGNALGRIAQSSGVGGLEGLLRKPEQGEDRLSNAKVGVGIGAGAGIAGEALQGLYHAAKGVKNAITPGSVKAQSEGLEGLLQGKNAPIETSKLGVAPKAQDEMISVFNQGPGNTTSQVGTPESVDMPLSWVNKTKQGLDKISRNELTGLPIPKTESEQATANYLRNKLHSASPEIDQAMSELSSNIGSQDLLNKAKDKLLKEGSPVKAATLGGAGLAGATIKGASRSLGRFGNPTLDDYLSILLTQPRSSEDRAK